MDMCQENMHLNLLWYTQMVINSTRFFLFVYFRNSQMTKRTEDLRQEAIAIRHSLREISSRVGQYTLRVGFRYCLGDHYFTLIHSYLLPSKTLVSTDNPPYFQITRHIFNFGVYWSKRENIYTHSHTTYGYQTRFTHTIIMTLWYLRETPKQ